MENLNLKQSAIFHDSSDPATIQETPDLFISKTNIRKSVMISNKEDTLGLTENRTLECDFHSIDSPSPLRNEYYQLAESTDAFQYERDVTAQKF